MPQKVYLDEQGEPIQASAPPSSKDAKISKGLTSEGYGVPSDVSIGGIPGKTIGGVLAMAGAAAPAVMRGMAGEGLGATGRAYAAVKAAAEQSSPILKYEATKSLLEHLGVPGPLATAAAYAVSGYKRGAKPTTGAAQAPLSDIELARQEAAAGRLAPSILQRMEEAAARASAPAAPVARPAAPPVAAPVAPPPPVVPATAAPPIAAAPAVAVQPPGVILKQMAAAGLNPSEVEQAFRWVKQGVDPSVIWQRIQEARALQATGPFAKLPSLKDALQAVEDRNTSGRWPQ
jgi:hypothetical protein